MKKVTIKENNDLATTCPELAKEWDYEANKDLVDGFGRNISTPDKVTTGSSQKVGWICPICGYKWNAIISGRVRGNGCPCCAGKVPACGTDLATTHPKIALEWDYAANADLKTKSGRDISTPDKVKAGSDQKVGWICPVCGYKWQALIKDRARGHGCPSCTMQVVTKGKDLVSTHPEIAKQWDLEANRNLKNGHGKDISTPDKVSAGSTVKVGWVCPVCGYKWQAMVKDRTHGYGCPCCSGLVVAPGKDLLSMFPEIANQWDSEANKDLKDGNGRDVSTPDKVSYGSTVKVGWKCPVCSQSWTASVCSRTKDGNGCPYCNKSKGEKVIRNVLKDNHISFEEQYKFKDRTAFSDKYPLRDDFAILDAKGNVVGTIEYNGRQHYELVDFSGHNPARAQKEFENIQIRDKIKSDYLAAHNIPQLIIPYWDFDKIEELVNDFIPILSLSCNVSIAC